MEHRSVAQTAWRVGIGRCKQGLDFFPRQIIDEPGVRSLDRQRADHHGLFEASRSALLDEAKERLDRRQPRIARTGGIIPSFLDMLKKRPHQSDIEILDHEFRRLPLEPRGGETQQERERMRVAGDGMRAGATFVRKVVLQERGEIGSERGHAAPPTKAPSVADAIMRNRTGVASRYQ